jgi:AraC-like DNA-binding protein
MMVSAHDGASGPLVRSSGTDARIPATRSDLLSQLLTLMRLQGEMIYTADLAAPWAIQFAAGAAHFHFVAEGRIQVSSPEIGTVEVDEGQLVLLPLGHGHVLADGGGAQTVAIDPTDPVFFDAQELALKFDGGGPSTRLFSGTFRFDATSAPIILEALPPIIRLSRSDGANAEWLEALVHFLLAEAHQPSPGSALMISRLIDVLVVQTLRTWSAGQSATGLGWLGALGDPGIERALAALHAEPTRDWIVEDLARIAFMSRSVFAERFTSRVGEPPLRYLKNWRLSLAQDMLRTGTWRVSEVARRAGYDSDASFSRAYKTRFGHPPAADRTIV